MDSSVACAAHAVEGVCPMDADRFDDMLRGLSQTPSRRGIVGALGGFALAGPLGALLDRATVEAKKKKGKKKKKCKGGKKKCGKKCIPKSQCCTNANCGAQGACVAGACVCLSGFKPCLGSCIPDDDCCGSCGSTSCMSGSCNCVGRADYTDCGGGRQCSGGVCATPPTCGRYNQECSSDGDCCSAFCPADVAVCGESNHDHPCYSTVDCFDGRTCVGFVCTA
jgi:hypothetical protein